MSQRLEHMGQPPTLWCGRSWEGLVDRRHAAFQHALALRNATQANSGQAIREFLTFFHEAGKALFRDEEQWIFSELRPTPAVVHRAREEHLEILGLIRTLLNEVPADRVAVGVVQHLGELLESHLLFEEEEIRPLLRSVHPALLPVS